MEPLQTRNLNKNSSNNKEPKSAPQSCSAEVQSSDDRPSPSPDVADCFEPSSDPCNAAACVGSSDNARMPMYLVHYPRLPLPTLPPRQRKPGISKTPSYTSSPISSPFVRSPPNVSRKRANAISLANSPARPSHSNSMTRIFEKSRETVQFQEEVRARSADERRQTQKDNQALPKTTAGPMRAAPALPGLPTLSPLSRLTYDMPGGLINSTHSRVTPSKPFHLRSSKAASKADSAKTPHNAKAPTSVPLPDLPLSPVESWLSTLPDQPAQTLPRPNTSKLRSSTGPLSPGAKTHRLCASASSIAERIQMRTPSFAKTFEPEQTPIKDEEADQHTASLLSRLLRPAARPSRKDSGVWASANPSKLHDAEPVGRSPDDAGTISGLEEASDRSSTSFDSGSSDVLYLPKLRDHDLNAASTPKAKIGSPSHEDIRNVTPEVAVFRKGKGPKKTRCTSYFDQDVIPPLRVKSRKEETEDEDR